MLEFEITIPAWQMVILVVVVVLHTAFGIYTNILAIKKRQIELRKETQELLAETLAMKHANDEITDVIDSVDA